MTQLMHEGIKIWLVFCSFFDHPTNQIESVLNHDKNLCHWHHVHLMPLYINISSIWSIYIYEQQFLFTNLIMWYPIRLYTCRRYIHACRCTACNCKMVFSRQLTHQPRQSTVPEPRLPATTSRDKWITRKAKLGEAGKIQMGHETIGKYCDENDSSSSGKIDRTP